MIRQVFISILILVAANLAAFIVLYHVYFPWATSIESKAVENQILEDVRELNFRLSLLDYNYSPPSIARAENELKTSISTEQIDQLQWSEDDKQNLKQNRYSVFMEGNNGPTGHVLLQDNTSVLTLGPYDDSYNDIQVKDWLIYLLLLVTINGAIVLLVYFYIQRILRPASFALDRIKIDGLELSRDISHLEDVSNNLPQVADHINKLEANYRKSLHNQRDLMHAVAHEFRSPMARMSFALELLESSKDKAKKSELQREIHESLDELDLLVSEVMGYSRLKHGKVPLTVNEFNLLEIVRLLCEKVEILYQGKQFSVSCNPESGFVINSDKLLIERALINLIRNAARFSQRSIKITLNKFHENFEIKIEDDGPGVPPGKRERIFEPFTRLDFSRNRDSGGAGLGLAICKGIVERLNGKVWAEDSRELSGASFTIILPLDQNID